MHEPLARALGIIILPATTLALGPNNQWPQMAPTLPTLDHNGEYQTSAFPCLTTNSQIMVNKSSIQGHALIRDNRKWQQKTN